MAVVRSACAFLAGCCAVLSLPALPASGTVATGIAVGALVAVFLRTWPVVMFALGFGAAWHEVSDRLSQRLAPALEGQTIALSGSVASVPQLRAEGVRFRFAPDPAAGIPALIELTWYEPEWQPSPAERLAVEVRLRRPRGFANPGGMDQEARLLRDCVGATGYVRGASSEGRGVRDVLRRPVLVARGEIYEAIRAALGERPGTGIVAGLSVGLQDALSREQWRALARSGTSHLMAISGMHISMQAAAAAWVALRIARWRQRRGALGAQRDAALLAGTLTALAYALLAGWSIPTQRTVLMIAIVAVALRMRRRIGVADGLALGVVAVLLLDPLAPLSVGFWLSFVAVAVILFVGTGHIRPPGTLAGFAQIQFAVTVGLVPVIAGGFGSISLVSVAVNAVAIPLYTLVIVPAVLVGTAAVIVVPPVGKAMLGAVAWLIETTWPLIEVPAALPYAVSGMAALPAAGWLLLTIGALATLAPLAMPGRVAGLLIVTSLVNWQPAPPGHGALRLTVLDVGQGLATVVQTRRHVLVYDTGPRFRSGTDTGLLVVEPYLRSRGLRRVDLLVASHDDDDHVGGAASLAALLEVRTRVQSGRALDAIGPATRCSAGQAWEWDGVRFHWLHPAVPLLPGDNDRSCVLQITAGERVLLLTGDAERLAEQQILDRGLTGPVDVVVVPHHGSRTSSRAAFVEVLAPRWAVVSAGHRNRWGFPAASVVQRWEAAGARVLRTSEAGAIEFDVRPGRALAPPARWRVDHPRPWADP